MRPVRKAEGWKGSRRLAERHAVIQASDVTGPLQKSQYAAGQVLASIQRLRMQEACGLICLYKLCRQGYEGPPQSREWHTAKAASHDVVGLQGLAWLELCSKLRTSAWL